MTETQQPARYTIEWFNEVTPGTLPGLVGMRAEEVRPGFVAAHLEVRPDLLAPNGYLHAATIVALADTACGFGCLASLPEGATGFTTIEVKANYLGTAREGSIATEARMAHGGRTTQVWDATVTNRETAATIALFRCTQMLLYPRE
jgi:1,4-dihydroxy-2-naphthoyl-CoA hydrolase